MPYPNLGSRAVNRYCTAVQFADVFEVNYRAIPTGFDDLDCPSAWHPDAPSSPWIYPDSPAGNPMRGAPLATLDDHPGVGKTLAPPTNLKQTLLLGPLLVLRTMTFESQTCAICTEAGNNRGDVYGCFSLSYRANGSVLGNWNAFAHVRPFGRSVYGPPSMNQQIQVGNSEGEAPSAEMQRLILNPAW